MYCRNSTIWLTRGVRILVHIHFGILVCPVQRFVDECHAPCPVLEFFFKFPPGRGFFNRTLKAQKRDERCKVILDPVVDLGEEDLFFRECLAELVSLGRQFPDVLVEFFLGRCKFLVRRVEPLRSSLRVPPRLFCELKPPVRGLSSKRLPA